MASTMQQVHPEAHSADVVGRAFVHQYYHILHKSPELVHRFYQEHSILGRPEENGMMSATTTMQAINDKILSLDYGNLSADIATVDAQDSYNGGVFVLVTGYLNGTNNLRQKFTQSFFLAPQDTGFYVFNDVFRYMGDGGVIDGGVINGDQTLVSDDKNILTPENGSSTLQRCRASATEIVVADDVDGEAVYSHGNAEVLIEEEEAPAPKVFVEIPDDSRPIGSVSKIEESPKKSYASILSCHNIKPVQKNAVLSSTPAPAPTSVPPPAPLKTIQKSQEPVLAAPTPISAPETVTSGPNVNENVNHKEAEEDGYSIYIKGLSFDTTVNSVETEFKRFGPIKAGGVQVRNQKGFNFGFVEFEVASAVQSALKASPILVNGCQVFVEEKRSTFRGGGGRGRFSSAKGSGLRNDGGRGRGFGSGRGFGRGDYFGGRAEFGSRNSNRGGYYRSENGGRYNRAGVLGPIEDTVKNTAIGVSATA